MITAMASRPAENVASLRKEDNLLAMMYRHSAKNHLLKMERLRQATEEGRNLYRIFNDLQGTCRLPQGDDLLDVTDIIVPSVNQTYCDTIWVDNCTALYALANDKMPLEERKDKISRVFPFIYLDQRLQNLTLISQLAGLVSTSVREQNDNLRRFAKSYARLKDINNAVKGSMAFACEGFMYMMHDISAGVDLSPQREDLDGVKRFKRLSDIQGISRQKARYILYLAQCAMPHDMQRFSLPEDVRKTS